MRRYRSDRRSDLCLAAKRAGGIGECGRRLCGAAVPAAAILCAVPAMCPTSPDYARRIEAHRPFPAGAVLSSRMAAKCRQRACGWMRWRGRESGLKRPYGCSHERKSQRRRYPALNLSQGAVRALSGLCALHHHPARAAGRARRAEAGASPHAVSRMRLLGLDPDRRLQEMRPRGGRRDRQIPSPWRSWRSMTRWCVWPRNFRAALSAGRRAGQFRQYRRR